MSDTNNPTADVEKLVKSMQKDIQEAINNQFSQFEKQSKTQFASSIELKELRDGTYDLKSHTEELASMVDQCISRVNVCIDEIRSLGGSKNLKDIPTEPIKKTRKALTLLELGGKK